MADNRQVPTLYDSGEATLGTVTNYDVSAMTLFVNCKNPQWVSIRTDATITIKFNSTSSPAITVSANTSISLDLQFHSMFITTTGSSAIKIVMTQTDPA